jgi:hypothetical protein
LRSPRHRVALTRTASGPTAHRHLIGLFLGDHAIRDGLGQGRFERGLDAILEGLRVKPLRLHQRLDRFAVGARILERLRGHIQRFGQERVSIEIALQGLTGAHPFGLFLGDQPLFDGLFDRRFAGARLRGLERLDRDPELTGEKGLMVDRAPS